MTPEEKSAKALALAHRLREVTQTEAWNQVMVPFLQQERDVIIEMMASMTDALQLMRYAGSIQTFHQLLNLETRSKEVIDRESEKKLSRFQQPSA